MIVILPYPPDLPIPISMFPQYKTDLQRWSRMSGFDPEIQGDIVLDNISWDHPMKIMLENAVGGKVTNNKNGITEILSFLGGCHELSLLSKMTRKNGESILKFVNDWETRLRSVERSGLAPYQVNGVDLLYNCNLIKEDRSLIKQDLRRQGLVFNCKNVLEAIRSCCYQDSLRSVDFEKIKMMRGGQRQDLRCCQIL